MGVFTALADLVAPRSGGNIPEIRDLTVAEETDVRGWTTGLVVDKPHDQVTVNMGLDTPGTVRESAWREWEDAIAKMDRMVATCTIDEAGGTATTPRIATTFRAVSKTQRKDISQLVTDVSLRQAELYERAESLELPVRPLDAATVANLAHQGLTGAPGTWDDLRKVDLNNSIEDLIINDHRRVACFSVDISRPEVADQLDGIMEDWEDDSAILRRTRFFRPYVQPEGTGEDMTTGRGRRWAIVTTTGELGDLSEIADGVLRAAFDSSPSIALAMRRMRGRQRTGAMAGLGIGVLGFQHIALAERSPKLDDK